MVFPIRKSVRILLSKKGSRTEAIIYYFLIPLVLIVQMYYFLSDPLVIIATLSQEAIRDKTSYNEALQLKILFEYVGLPLFYAFEITNIKNMILKYGLPIDDPPKNNIKLGLIVTGIGFVSYLLYVLIIGSL